MAAETPMGLNDAVAVYLRRPYTQSVVLETDGTFRAEIQEFPGCIATGDTREEALAALDDVTKDWLVAALERGQNIPEPVENNEFSGRLVLRMPKSLHKKAAKLADRDGVSLNHFIVASLAEYVGEQGKVSHIVPIIYTGILYANIDNQNTVRLDMQDARRPFGLKPTLPGVFGFPAGQLRQG